MTEVEGQLLGRALRIGKVLAKYGLRDRSGDGSIGQVHRATLESGERVVVKVQRPDAAEKILRDLGLLELFAEKTEAREALRRLVDIPAVIQHLSDSLRRELDFCQELSNVERLREVLAPDPRPDVPG